MHFVNALFINYPVTDPEYHYLLPELSYHSRYHLTILDLYNIIIKVSNGYNKMVVIKWLYLKLL